MPSVYNTKEYPQLTKKRYKLGCARRFVTPAARLIQSVTQRGLIELTLSATASLSECKFSLRYLYKISCLVMKIRQMIIHNNLSKMKIKILPTCLKGNNRDSLGEFGNISHGVLTAEGLSDIKLLQL